MPLNHKLLLLAMLAQVALTFALLIWLGASRTAAVRAREVRIKDIALGQNAWPPRITQIGNSYKSQFELPVLFYVAVVVSIVTASADLVIVVLAGIFAASRYAHAFVHTGSNVVTTRFNLFLVGVVALIAMWLVLAAHMLGFWRP